MAKYSLGTDIASSMENPDREVLPYMLYMHMPHTHRDTQDAMQDIPMSSHQDA